MASGDTMWVLTPQGVSLPATLYATHDVIQDASTPNALIPVLDFDPDAPAEWAHWFLTVPSNYDGGGFTISWKGGTDTANAGTLILDFRIVTIADATTLTGDLGLDGTHTSISDTPAATANQLNYSTTGTITHANAGSPSTGNRCAISVTRDVATDTNTGDLQLAEILILET